MLGGKTVLPSFEEFAESLRTGSVGQIQQEKEQSAYVQSYTCSTPRNLNTSDNFHISPLEASSESQHEIDGDRKNTTVIKKYWKLKLVDYDISKDGDSCLLDCSAKSTISMEGRSDDIHSRPQTTTSALCEERKIGTIELLHESKESILKIDYSEISVP